MLPFPSDRDGSWKGQRTSRSGVTPEVPDAGQRSPNLWRARIRRRTDHARKIPSGSAADQTRSAKSAEREEL